MLHLHKNQIFKEQRWKWDLNPRGFRRYEICNLAPFQLGHSINRGGGNRTHNLLIMIQTLYCWVQKSFEMESNHRLADISRRYSPLYDRREAKHPRHRINSEHRHGHAILVVPHLIKTSPSVDREGIEPSSPDCRSGIIAVIRPAHNETPT